MVRPLREEHAFADVFVSFLLARNARIQYNGGLEVHSSLLNVILHD